MKMARRRYLIILAAILCFAVTGCSFKSAHRRSSSVVQYLYPDEPDPAVTPAIPRLTLPLQVGIAFVPGSQADTGTYTMRGKAGTSSLSDTKALTERDKMALMKEVADNFKKYDFVKSIDLIPSAYLVEEGSFANLDQIRTMHGIDVIVLLSYDQVQFSDEGMASLTYLTIIGAYFIPGEKNDTHTMLDAAVFDIQSRKLLFRAPGISRIKSKATPINLSEQLRTDRDDGFVASRKDLIQNLEFQLEHFREKVKEAPADYKIIRQPGYTGGGGLDGTLILTLALMSGYGLWQRKNG